MTGWVMKTARVPSGPEIDALIHVTTEVTLAMELLESQTHDSIHQSMVDGVEHGMVKLGEAYTDLTPQQLKVVKACIGEGVYYACEYMAAHIQLHESFLGLCSETAPGLVAHGTVHDFSKHLTTLWEEVNS